MSDTDDAFTLIVSDLDGDLSGTGADDLPAGWDILPADIDRLDGWSREAWRVGADLFEPLGLSPDDRPPRHVLRTRARLMDDWEARNDGRAADLSEHSHSQWSRVMLAPVLDAIEAGTVPTLRPSVGRVGDDDALFYRGRVNVLVGESGSGKSFTALATCREVLADGGTALYIDHEDNAAGILARLLRMGVDPAAIRAERLVYLNPGERPSDDDLAAVRDLVADLRPVLVVIDSAGEALAIEGANPNADEDVARWFRRVPTALSRVRYGEEDGPAVLLLDHLPKDALGAESPVGSHRKKAATTGAMYGQKVRRAWSLVTEGSAELTVWKDRAGHWTRGTVAARLTVSPDGDADRVDLVPPSASAAPAWRPTALMERVSLALEASPVPLSEAAVVRAVSGKAETVKAALGHLVSDGLVTIESDGTARRTKLHRSALPYRDPDTAGATATTSTGGGAA